MQSVERMEKLKASIDRMSKLQHIEILRLLNKNPDVKLNENKSGVFVNLTCLCNEAVIALEEYVNYIDKQEKALKAGEAQIEEIERMYFA
jgi:hypothetical protein